MLLDKPWLDSFVEVNQKRLAEQYDKMAGALDARGVEFLGGGNATMFVWADLAGFVSPSASEKDRKQLENDIAVACRSKGVMISRAANYQAGKLGFSPHFKAFHRPNQAFLTERACRDRRVVPHHIHAAR